MSHVFQGERSHPTPQAALFRMLFKERLNLRLERLPAEAALVDLDLVEVNRPLDDEDRRRLRPPGTWLETVPRDL